MTKTVSEFSNLYKDRMAVGVSISCIHQIANSFGKKRILPLHELGKQGSAGGVMTGTTFKATYLVAAGTKSIRNNLTTVRQRLVLS